MTERDWLEADNPCAMLDFVENRLSERKLRLFACACCRRIWRMLSDPCCRDAVETAELYAEGLATRERLNQARLSAYDVQMSSSDVAYSAARAAYWLTETTEICSWAATVLDATQNATSSDPLDSEEEEFAHVGLLRDICGNPFRPIVIATNRRTATVTSLAEAIYAERAFDRLPILADALEDAGCTNADILDHCWGPGPHARGCWVVDLVLGKE